jgi:hypothetical protein
MHRTVVIGICLGLWIVSHAAAGQITPRPEKDQPTAAVGKIISAPGSVTRTGQVAARPIAADGSRLSAFATPAGLSMSLEELCRRLGYFPAHCQPMTSDTTYDLAFACFIRGMYGDAIALANHGLKIRPDARLLLLRGVCEMHVGRCAEAEATAGEYLNAVSANNVIGLLAARERINGPMRVRFEQILKHITS